MKHYKDFKSQQKIAQRQKIDCETKLYRTQQMPFNRKTGREKNYIEKRQTTKNFSLKFFCATCLLDSSIFSSLVQHKANYYASLYRIRYTLHCISVFWPKEMRMRDAHCVFQSFQAQINTKNTFCLLLTVLTTHTDKIWLLSYFSCLKCVCGICYFEFWLQNVEKHK